MPKRRRLTPKQKVIIIYHKQLGFIEQTADFVEYRVVEIGDAIHSTPFFISEGKECSGLECFWILPEELNLLSLQQLQHNVIKLQIRAIELSQNLETNMQLKINDPEFRDQELIRKYGFDIRDESWLETELAVTDRERNWFRFERENTVPFYHLLYKCDWDNIVRLFNDQFQDSIAVEQAQKLSSKRMRYVMGSTAIRLAGNPDRTQWKKLAREFEDTHRRIDERMQAWSESHKKSFPIVKTKKEFPFNPGPYFNECLERIPQYFVDMNVTAIRIGSVLRIVSYDPTQKYVRVDFPQNIREAIKPGSTESPWKSNGGDYLIYVTKNDVTDGFEFVEGSL